MLRTLTGAEAAVVVNNNAAATMLMLAALARGREVIISRGELVEIGGGFRVPDVMAQSGAILREVGTTNRTRAADYAAAIGDRTGLILRVHPSNFRIEGFTERPEARELIDLGRRFAIPVAEDLGSGNLLGAAIARGVVEPTVRDSVGAGYDVVCFSGDKLLGGPQAGIIVGTEARIGTIRRHPFMRAVRVGKMTYAALEATLVEYATGRARRTVPVARMLSIPADDVGQRAAALADAFNRLAGVSAWVIEGASTVGGGSAPGSALATELVAIEVAGLGADALEARLRRLDPPVIARIENDRLVLDLRTVDPDEDERLRDLLLEALSPPGVR
jgi:L-seryl-tRNA(Ser) seleniumtransferase